MLTDGDVERLFIEWKTPPAGRKLVREIRAGSPVRNLQYRMDGVRTRFISQKMGGKAIYAESRTCEFAAIYYREHDRETAEYYAQPTTLDLHVTGGKGATRFQHTPDLFLIENGFVIEEWRELGRLQDYAEKRPEQFYCDSEGRWHYAAAEKHLEPLGIQYRLRCSDEHPRIYLSNLRFLEDYALATAPPVDPEVRARLCQLLAEHNKIPHLSLVLEYGFTADQVFSLVLEQTAYVDLHASLLHDADKLVIYKNKTVAQADAVFRAQTKLSLPTSALKIESGSRFLFDGEPYQADLVGATKVIAHDVKSGASITLPLELVEQLFGEALVAAAEEQSVGAANNEHSLLNQKRLDEALSRLEQVETPEAAVSSARSVRRWAELTAGIASPQDKLTVLLSQYKGNTNPRLPAAVIAMADEAISTFHNTAKKPTVQAAYDVHVTLCEQKNVMPMSRPNFYKYAKKHEDVKAREGKRMAYQKAPIPLSFDFEHPVHGVLPHEVCYCDHTILNVFLKGSIIEDLGKPTITLMVDGALSKARAFFLSYQPASAVSVLMCLRDYVRRHGRLPKVLVVDNGKEFHSEALKVFCSLFGIEIRWRRRSRPRDSSIVERMLGATEQEVISQLDGNSLALKDPRMVSSTHHPDKHIAWTLPGLYYSIEYFLFDVHANRIHPRFGISPSDMEKRLKLQGGTRAHVLVRYDDTFKLLTAPHSGLPTRKIDRKRGVFVDGEFYWHDKLALAKPDENAVVRAELWNAHVVYVNFRNEWYVARARDGSPLEGRFHQERAQQEREEKRERRKLAQKDKSTAKTAKKRVATWDKNKWDPRVREQLSEMYYLYQRLGMAEVRVEATNPHGASAILDLRSRSELALLESVMEEPDFTTPEHVAEKDDSLVTLPMSIATRQKDAAESVDGEARKGVGRRKVAEEDFF